MTRERETQLLGLVARHKESRSAEIARQLGAWDAAHDLEEALIAYSEVREIAISLLDHVEYHEKHPWGAKVLQKDWACPQCETPGDRIATDIQVDPTFRCARHAAMALRTPGA